MTTPAPEVVTVNGETEAANKNTDGKRFDLVKTMVSLIVAGFAAVMSYIGLKGPELTTVLRNQADRVELIGLFILLAVFAAILSVFVPNTLRALTFGQELAVVLGQVAAYCLIEPITPLPIVTTPSQKITHWTVAGVLALIALVVLPLARTVPDPEPAAVGPAALEQARRQIPFLRRKSSPVDFYLFLVIVSLLFTSLAVYTGIRIEARNQATAGVALEASLHEDGPDSVLTVNVAASHLLIQDLVLVTVTALPSHFAAMTVCKDVAMLGFFSCVDDPCSYREVSEDCSNLVAWTVPPDTSGDVDSQLTIPFLSSAYQRLHVETYVCEGARKDNESCEQSPAPKTHLDLAVP